MSISMLLEVAEDAAAVAVAVMDAIELDILMLISMVYCGEGTSRSRAKEDSRWTGDEWYGVAEGVGMSWRKRPSNLYR